MIEYTDELLAEILPMIKKIAWQLDEEHSEDLIEVGKEAFLKCLRTYDSTKKTKFSTHVYNKAKRAMQDEIRKTGWFKRINDETFKMILFSDFNNEESLQGDMEELILGREKSGIMKEAIKKLPKEHAKVMKLIYWNGMTRLEAASSLQLTESRVSQIHSQAIEMIEKDLNI